MASADPSGPHPNQNQDRLKAHFQGHGESAHGSRWDKLWEEGTFIPWDRGYANPALIDALNEHQDASRGIKFENGKLGSPLKSDGRRKRALVPGCGKGYDLVLFAAHGYDSFGIEVSENAVRVANEYLHNPGLGPLEGEYNVNDEKVGRGAMRCGVGDFFKDDWAEEAGGIEGGFDVIYDNTFLCALPYSLRPAWAKRMAELLSPTGILVCLEFPTHKPPTSGGPPWSLPSVVHDELLKRPGEDIEYDESGKALASNRPASDDALVLLSRWQPARTHQAGTINGEVRDRVSVWMRKNSSA